VVPEWYTELVEVQQFEYGHCGSRRAVPEWYTELVEVQQFEYGHCGSRRVVRVVMVD
jgi:hypothetical protein